MVFATTIFLCGVAPLFLPHTSAFITRSHAIYSTPRGQPRDAPVPRSRAEQQQKGSMCIYNNYQRDLAQPALSLAKFKRAMQLRGIHRATSSTSTWITRNARLTLHDLRIACGMCAIWVCSALAEEQAQSGQGGVVIVNGDSTRYSIMHWMAKGISH